MAPKRNSTRSSTPSYNPELVENWTIARLRAELESLGRPMPSNTRRIMLVRRVRAIQAEQDLAHAQAIPAPEMPSQDASSVNNDGSDQPSENLSKQEFLQILSRLESRMDSRMEAMTSAMESITENVDMAVSRVDSLAHITRNVDNLSEPRPGPSSITPSQDMTNTTSNSRKRRRDLDESEDEEEGNTLKSAYELLDQQTVTNQQTGNHDVTEFGYAAHTMKLVETVTPTIRRRIIQGRDVNLSTLLIPYYSGPDNNQNANNLIRPDPRLNRHLTIGEFILAFGIYKHIMCTVHKRRRVELDIYERDIVNMTTRYNGKGFYEYHRRFSLNSASDCHGLCIVGSFMG